MNGWGFCTWYTGQNHSFCHSVSRSGAFKLLWIMSCFTYCGNSCPLPPSSVVTLPYPIIFCFPLCTYHQLLPPTPIPLSSFVTPVPPLSCCPPLDETWIITCKWCCVHEGRTTRDLHRRDFLSVGFVSRPQLCKNLKQSERSLLGRYC